MVVFTDEMAEQTELLARNNFGSPLFREIHKNSWLTKVSSNDTKKVNQHLIRLVYSRNYITYRLEKRKSMGSILRTR